MSSEPSGIDPFSYLQAQVDHLAEDIIQLKKQVADLKSKVRQLAPSAFKDALYDVLNKCAPECEEQR